MDSSVSGNIFIPGDLWGLLDLVVGLRVPGVRKGGLFAIARQISFRIYPWAQALPLPFPFRGVLANKCA